jgi:hypothetical protein
MMENNPEWHHKSPTIDELKSIYENDLGLIND